MWNLPEKEAKQRIEKDGWTVIEKPIEEVIKEQPTEKTIEEYREDYSAKYNKDVPNCKKNDLERIKSKL